MLVVVLDGAIMGLVAPAAAADSQAGTATVGLMTLISTLMMAALIMAGARWAIFTVASALSMV